MSKYINVAIDLMVFCLAALGSLMAFGIGAAYAVIKSAFVRKNPITLAMIPATQARRLLAFIYAHSGLPALINSVRNRARKNQTRNKH